MKKTPLKIQSGPQAPMTPGAYLVYAYLIMVMKGKKSHVHFLRRLAATFAGAFDLAQSMSIEWPIWTQSVWHMAVIEVRRCSGLPSLPWLRAVNRATEEKLKATSLEYHILARRSPSADPIQVLTAFITMAVLDRQYPLVWQAELDLVEQHAAAFARAYSARKHRTAAWRQMIAATSWWCDPERDPMVLISLLTQLLEGNCSAFTKFTMITRAALTDELETWGRAGLDQHAPTSTVVGNNLLPQ